MPIFAFDDFNSYTGATFSAAWTVSDGAIALTSGTNLSLGAIAPPDGSQYVHAAQDFRTSTNDPWGTVSHLISRTFTGLTPLTEYEIRFKMDTSYSGDDNIGSFPGKHQMTIGMTAGTSHRFVSVIVPAGPAGPTYPNDAPSDDTATLYTISPWRPPAYLKDLYASLDGWKDYSFNATADGSGHLLITTGIFDLQNFVTGCSIDSLEIHTIPTVSTRKRAYPQVFGVGR